MNGFEIAEALAHLESCPVMAPLIVRLGVVHYPADRSAYHYLARAIVSQQLSSKAADTIWARFVALYGGDLPDPGVLASADQEALRSVGLSRPKASYMVDLAGRFASGELRDHELTGLSNEDISARLTQVKGLGQWTVDMFLMFGLNRRDVLPVGDLGIRKAMSRQFGWEGLPKPDEMLVAAEPWRPYRTAACWYLWRSLEPEA